MFGNTNISCVMRPSVASRILEFWFLEFQRLWICGVSRWHHLQWHKDCWYMYTLYTIMCQFRLSIKGFEWPSWFVKCFLCIPFVPIHHSSSHHSPSYTTTAAAPGRQWLPPRPSMAWSGLRCRGARWQPSGWLSKREPRRTVWPQINYTDLLQMATLPAEPRQEIANFCIPLLIFLIY